MSLLISNKNGLAEKEIQASILDYLKYRKGFFWRNNSGAFVGERHGKKRFFRFGLKGSADIIGLVPPDGKFIAIEVKSKNGNQSPDQRLFQEQIEQNGGIFVLARSVQDVIEATKNYSGGS